MSALGVKRTSVEGVALEGPDYEVCASLFRD
jgi:hypothetical protein